MNPYEYVHKQVDRIQYAPVDRVIEMILRDYKFIPKLKVSDVIEWIGACYGLLNYPGMFRHKITGVEALTPNVSVTQYRGELPVDFRKVLKAGVRDYDTKEVYRPSTGTFTEFQYGTNVEPKYKNTDKVYSIRGGYIFIEDETATLEIAYEAFPIDDRGYPLVPDDERVLSYMRDFIAEKESFNLLAARKIDQYVYDEINKRRMFRAGSAHAALVNPSPDTMESWTWSRLKLMPRILAHESSFSYHGNKEDMPLGTNLDL
jgi:hypothetical protein